MFSLRSSLEPSKLFTAYSTLTGTVFLVQSTVNQLIPHRLQTYIWSKLNIDRLFTKPPEELTIFIREYHGLTRNQVFEAAEIYLPTKINESNNFLEIGKGSMDDNLSVTIEKGEQIVDYFDDICLKWTFSSKENEKTHQTKHFYELRFKKQFKDRVLEGYVPYLLARANEIKEKNRVVNLCTMTSYGDSIELRHPATFDKLAMDPELKQAIKDDLDRFVKRKEFYNKVGKAWKRGYLLYGPPGTGKSSLIAAIANYLKFDIYDLELTSVYSNSRFRDLLLSTSNRSIIVIEDIDCTREVQKRNTTRTNNRAPADEDDAADEDEAGDEDEDSSEDDYNYPSSTGFTLSGMLNFIDGLWSSCGDERIIIFTTNHKDRLDPALLRPGRMDMHIHMSYCTPAGFRILVSNYLDIHDGNHPLCGQIEDLITKVEVTPAEIAEQLMKSEDPDHALSGLLDFLESKIQLKDNGVNKVDLPQA